MYEVVELGLQRSFVEDDSFRMDRGVLARHSSRDLVAESDHLRVF